MAETFEVAHFRQQGVDLIVINVNSSFGRKSAKEQKDLAAALQLCASDAGLAGTVVPVWETSRNRMEFLAPQQWHSFFKSLTMLDVAANVNRKLTCSF